MRVLCLWFPRLGVALARRQRPQLTGRPVVLIAGHGDDAVVADRSCEAGANGVLAGLSAGRARSSCPGAVFLPDNAGACLDELERIAAILRTRATTRVAVGGRDHLLLELDAASNEVDTARRLGGLARAWAGLDVRAGVASTPTAAFEAARASRRAPVVVPAHDEPPGAEWRIPAFRSETLAANWTAPAPMGAFQARARIVRLLSHLDAVLAARNQSFRAAEIALTAAGGAVTVNVDLPPVHAASALLPELAGRIDVLEFERITAIRITLSRLGPDVRVRPLPASAARRSFSGRESSTLRRAG